MAQQLFNPPSFSGKPYMFIDQDDRETDPDRGYIDFGDNDTPWLRLVYSMVNIHGMVYHKAAFTRVDVNRRVYVRKSFFYGLDWEDLWGPFNTANAFAMASHSRRSNTPCDTHTMQDRMVPFLDTLHVPAHYSGVCVNCFLLDYQRHCKLNRMLTPICDRYYICRTV
jgi:hypothetical protein